MSSYKWCICTFVALLSTISSITARKQYDDNQIVSNHKIIVDPSGKRGFKTIQAAIDSVPSNNQIWTTIDIKRGVYKEQVFIPRDKQFVYLKGAGKETTIIIWDGHDATNTSATFTSEANNTLAKDITFTNSYNYHNHVPLPPSLPDPLMERGVAARIRGDKSVFYQCGFFGLQDTLWDDKGRHYYKSCTIEGAVDFIFGAGQSQYENCTISISPRPLIINGILAGYITAQGRENAQDTNGFVLKECNIVGNGKAFLGRPWRDYAKVFFYNTTMSSLIVPQGWSLWDKTGKESQLSLSEYNCSGPGAMSSQRVSWEKKLSEEEVKQLIDISFIDNNEGWVRKALHILNR